MSDAATQLTRNAAQVIPADGLEKKLQSKRQLTVKLGLDPTAPDIHLGHTVVLRKLRQFQDQGHKIVLIVGDFTAKIGDPSGRSKTRPVLSDAEIKMNAATYKKQSGKILDTKKLDVRFNSEWLKKLKLDDVLKLMGKVTVSQVLDRDDFRDRQKEGKPVGLHELLYPLMQAYDSVAIKADVEIGGTDQTFNLLMGRTLQEAMGLEPQVVLTMPLIVGLDGKEKMSKSLGNFIGVTESAKDIYGKAMSLPDEHIATYAALTTELSISKEDVARDPLAAKKLLAQRLAEKYTSAKHAEAAAKSFTSTFSKGEFPADADELVIRGKTTLLDFVTKEHKLFASNSEARRKILEGAVHLNGEQMRDPAAMLDVQGEAKLRIGKKQFYRITRQG